MRRYRLWLGLSLVLNLFLAGVVIGGSWWIQRREPVIAAGSLRVVGSELGDDRRRALRASLRETRRSLRDTVDAGRGARREAAALLRQDRPDRAAILAALARARVADTVVRAAVETRALETIAALPRDERERVADAMVRRAEGPRRRR